MINRYYHHRKHDFDFDVAKKLFYCFLELRHYQHIITSDKIFIIQPHKHQMSLQKL